MKVGFYSMMSCLPWGGSEELWSRAAARLLARGHQVTVNYKRWPQVPTRLAELREQGARLHLRTRIGASLERRMARKWNQAPHFWLDSHKPDFVLITSGLHSEELPIAAACRYRNIPYAINLQAASCLHWVDARRYEGIRAAYAGAQRCFFVSRENQEIVEANLALRLTNACQIDNPFAVSVNPSLGWPTAREPWRLACVGRLNFASKGQDLIVHAMKQPQWRGRSLVIDFWGQDHGSEQSLRDLITLHGLEDRLRLRGFAQNIEKLWSEYHGLVLPSRYEGSALVLLEAMRCGRMAVATDCGRARDFVRDGETGFLAAAPAASLVGDALERAWQARSRWREMGTAAAALLRRQYSDDPAEDFASHLQSLVMADTPLLSKAA